MSRIIEFRKSAQKAEKQSVQGKTCAFTGHRPQSLPFGFDESDKRCTSLKSVMRDQIVALIENEDVTHFITGMALGVDMYAAEIVLDLKSKYPHITLESAIPCETQAIKWSVASRERYYNIAAKCDKETMLQREYTPDCMDKRNRYMVDHADYILAVWNGCPSGTGNTVRYAHKKGKTIIVIEHHTEYIADYCRHVMLMKDGQVQWMLPTDEALRRVEELEACNIFPPQVTRAAHRMRAAGKLAALAALPTTVEQGKAAFASLNHCPRPLARSGPAREEAVVAFQGVRLAYRSVKGAPREVFHDLNLEIHRGEKVALIGSNGAGKSTLMKLMVGLLRPGEGTVSLFGEPIGEKRAEDLSRQISLVYQNPEEMFIKDSIRGDIAYAMQVRQVPRWEQRTEDLLARFRLTDLAQRDGRLMSGGQMRRASLAIGIALDPGILLLDEPTANLDIATRREILSVLEEMKGITETAVIATHDMQLVCQWADRIIVLSGGKVVADGTRDEVFSQREVVDQVGIRPPEIFTMAQALDPAALCYTIEEFLESFQEGTPCSH